MQRLIVQLRDIGHSCNQLTVDKSSPKIYARDTQFSNNKSIQPRPLSTGPEQSEGL